MVIYLAALEYPFYIVITALSLLRCQPCSRMSPVVSTMSETYTETADFVKVNIEELEDAVAEHNVKMLPTFIFFMKGTELDRVEGADLDEFQRRVHHWSAPRAPADSETETAPRHPTELIGTSVAHNDTFQGQGHRLGDAKETIRKQAQEAEASGWISSLFSWLPFPGSSGQSNTGETVAQEKMQVNESEAQTLIQIRLADSSK